jgi:dienelactone hydrolase
MNRFAKITIALSLAMAVAAPAFPQSLPNLALANLNYTVRKRTVNPQGELKEKIDQNDRELAEARRVGRMGDVRRLLAKGQALLAGTAWTDELDFANSITLRTERVFVDTQKPYAIRIEQIYASTLAVDHNLTAHASLLKPRAGGRGGNGAGGGGGGRGVAAATPPEVAKDFGAFEDVSRDLRESPYLMELDLGSVADGTYQIRVEVMDGAKTLGSTTLRIIAVKGLDDSLAHIDKEAAAAPESIRADALYPGDFVRNVNRGRVDAGAFDVTKEIANVEDMLASAKSGKDPFAGRTGDFKRHYMLKAASEIMPYRLYIPPAYDGTKAYPMVLALHGLGGTEDSMFGQTYRVPVEAEKRGYIVAAPLGYRIDGGYGRAATRAGALSEADVMEVLARVRHDYKVDDSRIYLLGHSMGGFGTWVLGPKYPSIWAAMAPISGGGQPASLEKIKDIPEIVVHGDADNVVPVGSSRTMVEAAKNLGIEVKYIEVPGGTHGDVAAPSMSAIFDFFDAHRKGKRSPTGGGQ